MFRRHFEWSVLLAGILLMAMMDPHSQGISLCLFDLAGVPYCPGEGLGHSVAFLFRGEWQHALNAHMLGPAAVAVLGGRILVLWKKAFFNHKTESSNGKNDRLFTGT